jgi:hypothetical protein
MLLRFCLNVVLFEQNHRVQSKNEDNVVTYNNNIMESLVLSGNLVVSIKF